MAKKELKVGDKVTTVKGRKTSNSYRLENMTDIVVDSDIISGSWEKDRVYVKTSFKSSLSRRSRILVYTDCLIPQLKALYSIY